MNWVKHDGSTKCPVPEETQVLIRHHDGWASSTPFNAGDYWWSVVSEYCVAEENYWTWWASNNGEVYRVGPCASREEVIEQGKYKGWECFEICEAENPPLRLSDWIIDVDSLLEYAEDQLGNSDRVNYEVDEPPYFDGFTPAQKDDLEQMLKRTVDEWQQKHKLVFKVRTFARIRNEQTVVVGVGE